MRTLQDYKDFMHALIRTISVDVQFEANEPLEIVLRNPRLVTVINHSTPISWVPPIALLCEKVCEAGGGDRIPRGIMDRFFYTNPLTLPIAEYVTQSKTPQSFDELLRDFTSRERTDLVIFPEGAMTFFGDLNQIQPFRSPRFIELAIRARAPILMCVHRGTEDWNVRLPLPVELISAVSMFSKFFGEKLQKDSLLNLPIRLTKVKNFRMRTKVYLPELYEADLSSDPTERRAQLSVEAEKIRELMQEMFDELASPHKETSARAKTEDSLFSQVFGKTRLQNDKRPIISDEAPDC